MILVFHGFIWILYIFISDILKYQFSSIQSLSRGRIFVTQWTRMPRLPVHHQLLEFTQTHVHWVEMPSNCLILCCPLLLLPSIFPSIRVFSNESVLRIRWPNYWTFSFNMSPDNEYSGLISFKTDWFDLLAVQETLKSSPAPQFESIDSLALSLLYGPTLPSVCDYWKNHIFDYTDFCWRSDVFAL